MIANHDPAKVIRRLTRWADGKGSIRAMLLTSTRANPHAPVDILSDYDVVLVVEDIQPFFEDRSWIGDFGEVLVAYWDPVSSTPTPTPTTASSRPATSCSTPTACI